MLLRSHLLLVNLWTFCFWCASAQTAFYTAGQIIPPPVKADFDKRTLTDTAISVTGDTISNIALKLDVPVPSLEKFNPQITNFNVVPSSEVFNVPAAPVDGNLILCDDQYYLPSNVRSRRVRWTMSLCS